MDAITAITGILISLAVCVVLVVAAKVSFREREYEEVFGRQQHSAVSSAAKKAPKKKKAKSKGGAQSDVTTDDEGKGASSGDRDESDETSGDHHPHVEYDPDPVVIDEPVPAIKAKPEHIPKKSILRNRSDSLKETEVVVPAESEKKRQRGSFTRIPKDEVELKHHPELKSRHSAKAAHSASDDDRETSSSAGTSDMLAQEELIESAQRAVTYESAVQQQLPRDEDGAPSSAVATAAAAVETKPAAAPLVPAAEPTKKTKAKTTAVAAAASTKQPTATARRVEDVNSIVDAVQRASLSKADVQVLIDALLGKDESSPSWTTKVQKGDPVAQLAKQLEDKDRLLLEERQQAATATAQLSRLGKELQEERARRAQGEQQAAERTAALGGELAALRQRMQQSHEQHVRELAALRHQTEQEQAAAISRLSQENQQLKQALPLPSEMKALKEQAQIVKNELAKSIQNLTSAEQKCRRLEEQVATKDQLLGDLKQQAIKMQVVTSEAEQAKLQATQAKQDAELQASQLKNKLDQTNQAMASMDLTIKDRDKEIQMLKQQLNLMDERRMPSSSQAAAELEDHKSQLLLSQAEVSRLQAKLDDVQRQATSLKEVVGRQTAAASGMDAEQQQRAAAASEMAAEVESLRHAKLQLEHRQAQLDEERRQIEARLQAELGEAKRRNDDLRRKNWLLSEAVESAEKLAARTPDLQQQLDNTRAGADALTSRVKRLEERNTELVEIQQKLSSAASAASTEVESLRSQLKQQHEREHRLKSDLDHSRQQLSQLTNEASRHRVGVAAAETQAAAKLNELRQQLISKEFEIDSLQADLEVQRQTADAFKVKYDKAEKVDHSHGGGIGEAATADVLQQLKAYQEELAKLKEQLSARAVSTAPLEQMRKQSSGRQAGELTSVVTADEDLRRQLEAQKAKNNELRERNWKLAEALDEAQKHRGSGTAAAASTSAAAAPAHASVGQVKQVFARLYPAVRLDPNLTDDAWLSQLEAAVREHEQKDAAVTASHKRLLVQTDQALATVQARLEAEERKWQQTVAAKDGELTQLRDQLQKLAEAAT